MASCFLGLSSMAGAVEGYLVVERHSKRILLSANAQLPVAAQDLGMITTAKVVIDWSKYSGTPMTELILIPNFRAMNNPLGLQPGDRLSLRDAVYSVLMRQDMTSAAALVEHVGVRLAQRGVWAGSPSATFVREMNYLAQNLKMKKTKFELRAGGGKTTVSDIARMSCHIAADPAAIFYTKQKKRKVQIHRLSGNVQNLVIQNSNTFAGKNSTTGLFVTADSGILSLERSPYVVKRGDGNTSVTPVQMVVVSVGTQPQSRDTVLAKLREASWPRYEQWRAMGYPSSAAHGEYLLMQ